MINTYHENDFNLAIDLILYRSLLGESVDRDFGVFGDFCFPGFTNQFDIFATWTTVMLKWNLYTKIHIYLQLIYYSHSLQQNESNIIAYGMGEAQSAEQDDGDQQIHTASFSSKAMVLVRRIFLGF